ncbi:CO dehydrogenase/acetyl-CoA synthase alpha subunit [Paraburkholderia youngii]|uniref:hypothetical protein n=1 Tax=Paraburkholderia youngii TaxID=2782701 RepID=UPI003D1B4849
MANEGIVVKGRASFSSHQTVVGKKATIVNNAESTREVIINRLDHLTKQVKDADLPTNERDHLVSAIDSVKNEAMKESPDKSIIERTLSFINLAAPSVSAIATAGKAIEELVSKWTVN